MAHPLRPLLAPLLATLSACFIAPPARIGGGGAPGRSLAHSGEVNVGLVTPSKDGAEDPFGYTGLGFSPADRWRIEAGFESLANYPHGYAGLRYNAWQSLHENKGGVLDVEAGVAAGAGANGCENADSVCDTGDGIWDARRITGGGYVGSGIGYHHEWFDLYSRGRVQATGAQGLEPTLWYSLQGGVQFNAGDYAHVYMATGGTGVAYLTSPGTELFWVPLELGLVLTFGGER